MWESEDRNHHCLFKEKSITAGLAPSFSFHIETIGANSRFYYNLGEKFCFGSEFSFFRNSGVKVFDVDLIVHYIFETKLVGLYPLSGANYTIEENEIHTKKKIGVVAGAGIHRNFKNLTVFTEYAHVESKLKDDFITIGLMINFK